MPHSNEDIPTIRLPRLRKKGNFSAKQRTIVTVLLVFLMLAGAALAYGYHYYQTNIQEPLSQFIHTVQRSQDEPAANNAQAYDTIMGRSWNILLLGSDNDNKYTFPAILTQVMLVVHVDTITNSVYLVSIPRD